MNSNEKIIEELRDFFDKVSTTYGDNVDVLIEGNDSKKSIKNYFMHDGVLVIESGDNGTYINKIIRPNWVICYTKNYHLGECTYENTSLVLNASTITKEIANTIFKSLIELKKNIY